MDSHILFKLYYGLMLPDIIHRLGFDATAENKEILHAFHKRVLKYHSIAGASHESLSKFLFEVGVFWAERGIFVRSNSRQEWGLEEKPLADLWNVL